MTALQPYRNPGHGIAARILVMEDDLGVAAGLAMVINEQGFEVNLAETGWVALQAFEQNHFDLLIADLGLPDIDGPQIIEQVKSRKPATQIIVISGCGTPAIAVKLMKLGVCDFLPKPFTEDRIKAAINEALAGNQPEPGGAGAVKSQTAKKRLIGKQEVQWVLRRIAEDRDCWSTLPPSSPPGMADRSLRESARTAPASGAPAWNHPKAAALSSKQLAFIKRHEREAW